jgi:hypothetical protein
LFSGLGVDADRIDDTVGPGTPSQALERLDRALTVEVDDLRAEPACLLKSRGDVVDGKHAPRALKLCAAHREEPNRPHPEHGDNVPGLDLGECCVTRGSAQGSPPRDSRVRRA